MTFLDKILNYYNYSKEDYQNYIINQVDKSFFDEYKNNEDILKGINIINDSIKNNEKIIIYGDYDCDGILSTSIIYKTLKTKINDIGFYIPFRKSDGYGLNFSIAEQIIQKNYKLVILVDNGITLFDQIEYLKENGVKVIIIDHHEIGEKLPNADALIHWKTSNISKINISAGGLSLIFSVCFLNYADPYLLALGAITILSDSMPLINSNRDIVRLGLKSINDNRFLKIIRLMGVYKNIYNEDDLNSNFIPKVNSIGRIVEDNTLFRIVKYFIDDDKLDTKRLNWINHINENRKELLTNIDFESLIDDSPINFITLDIEEGIIGLISNRLLNLTNKPSFVLTKSDNFYKGSARSKKGQLNIYDCLANNKDLLLNFGGHESAGGFSVSEENMDKLKNKIIDFYLNSATSNNFETKYIDIDIKELNLQNLEIFESFAPFGNEHLKPQFILKDFSTKAFQFSKDHKHIITKLTFDSKIIFFNYPEELLNCEKLNLIGYIEKNTFNGKNSCDFKVQDFSKAT